MVAMVLVEVYVIDMARERRKGTSLRRGLLVLGGGSMGLRTGVTCFYREQKTSHVHVGRTGWSWSRSCSSGRSVRGMKIQVSWITRLSYCRGASASENNPRNGHCQGRRSEKKVVFKLFLLQQRTVDGDLARDQSLTSAFECTLHWRGKNGMSIRPERPIPRR